MDTDKATAFAHSIGATHFLTSAKEETNVNVIFTNLVAQLPVVKEDDDDILRNRVNIGKKERRSGGCC